MVDLNLSLTNRQVEAFELLTNDESLDVLYGGAKGGGKSYLLCFWVFLWSLKLINIFGLRPSSTPLPVGFMGRKRSIDFARTTLETWKAVIPKGSYVLRELHKEIIIGNAVKVIFGGLDDTDSINKFNSAELCFVAIDQAEETTQDDVSVIEASLRRKHNNITPPYKVLYTANPRQCWLKKRYISDKRDRSYFVRALPSDNKHLPITYEDTLKNAFGHNKTLLAAYLYGDWDVFEGMYFDIFDRRMHVYNSRELVIQPEWPRFRSIDWGYASPMSCHWHAIGPDKHVYTYREWYKTRVLDVDAAREIKAITEEAGEKIEYTVVDPQSFPVEIPHFKLGRTIPMKRSEVWAEEGINVIMGDSNRVAGWSLMRDYLRPREYMGKMSSWWHISDVCTNLIDELSTATHDKNKIEDVSVDSSDHALEECRLFFMSRPPIFETKVKFAASMLEAAELQAERNKKSLGNRLGA
jgi:PBSX family phage terminase large subunit